MARAEELLNDKFVSCLNCGFVEVYNPSILDGKTRGELTTILDILFG
jgi:predicted nucleic-acid-binding Zn-ribbon protein